MPVLLLESIAQRVGAEIVGDPQLPIAGADSLEHAGSRDITFVTDEKHARALRKSKAGACLISRKEVPNAELPDSGMALLLVDDPQDAFLTVLREFRPQRPRRTLGISPAAHVSPTAQIGPNCNIFPGAFIDDGAIIGSDCDIHPGVFVGQDCRIGDHCVLYANVTLYPDCSLGDHVIIHASAVLGADGFGYRFRQGRFEKIPQLGSVRIENHVEIGACTTIDRGMIGPTVIGEGTKLDNLVMIGHNCRLGKHNGFASQVGLAGSVTTGDYVRCAGQVGIRDHVHLGQGSMLLAKAGVHKDVPDGVTYIGVPAGEEREQLKMVMSLGKVPELRKRMRDVESQLNSLAQQVQSLASSGFDS